METGALAELSMVVAAVAHWRRARRHLRYSHEFSAHHDGAPKSRLRNEANIERDLKVLGLANVAIAALGGYVSCTVVQPLHAGRTAGATAASAA